MPLTPSPYSLFTFPFMQSLAQMAYLINAEGKKKTWYFPIGLL